MAETRTSVISLRKAFKELQDANKTTATAVPTMNMLENISSRIRAIESDSKQFKSSNFGAAELHQSLGIYVPCSTYQDCASTVAAVVSGDKLHPKRFGGRQQSLVIPTNASKIFDIPDPFTGHVVVGVPLHASYKGAVFYNVLPDGSHNVIGYASPDRDPEMVGVTCAALFSKLCISAPAAVTGTTVAVTSQVMLELLKHECVSPVALIPGKCAPLAVGRRCPIVTIGPEQHDIVHFSAPDPISTVKRFSAFDPQNPNLSLLPNPDWPQTVSGAYPMQTNNFIINSTARDTASAQAAGFSSLASSWGLNISSSVNKEIWRLSKSNDYHRHMLYGDFDISFAARTFTTGGAICDIKWVITYFNGDGTTSDVTVYTTKGNTDTAGMVGFNTRGNTVFTPYDGAIIKDIVLSMEPFGGGTVAIRTADPVTVQLSFLDIPASTSYFSAVLSGIRPGFKVACSLEIHTEVILDPGALNATFLTASDDLPHDDQMLANYIRSIGHLREHSFNSASYKDIAKRVLKTGGTIGKLLAPLAGRYAPLVEQGADLAYRFGDYRAAGFRQPTQRSSPQFFFPSIDTDAQEYIISPLVPGGAIDPIIQNAIPRATLGVPDLPISGGSSTLAQLLANLALSGFPVKPGVYSGEVLATRLTVTRGVAKEVSFVLAPVALEMEKILAAHSAKTTLIGYFADGWYNGYDFGEPNLTDLFYAHVKSTIKMIEDSDYPVPVLSITAWVSA